MDIMALTSEELMENESISEENWEAAKKRILNTIESSGVLPRLLHSQEDRVSRKIHHIIRAKSSIDGKWTYKSTFILDKDGNTIDGEYEANPIIPT